MSLTFKDYKINHIALLFIKVLTLSQKQVKIQKFSAFDRSNLLLDRSKNEEIHHYASASFDWFSIPVRSIEINIWLIERNSWSIETLITEFFQNFLGIVFDIFIVFYQNTFWFYQWRFTDQTLGFSVSRSRTIIMLETLKT